MGDINIDAIRARAEAATPGPWDSDGYSVGANDDWVAHIPGYDPGEGAGNPRREPDAEFIAHAREDVPALLAELAAWKATVDAYESGEGHRAIVDERDRLAAQVQAVRALADGYEGRLAPLTPLSVAHAIRVALDTGGDDG